jgi:CBS domain-containing protein
MDLIEGGLLQPDTRLYFRRRLGEAPHESVVTDRGRLRLADGREFDSPSAAGRAAAKVSAVPGWIAWHVGSADGTTLHELRAELLRRAAQPQDEALLAFLELALQRATEGDPVALRLLDLLGKWGVNERERDVLHRIDIDLANSGLTTEPDFRAVGPNHVVRLVLPHGAEDVPPVPPGEAAAAAESPAGDGAGDGIGLTLGYLIDGKAELVALAPSASLEKAITMMEINDFSQLAVLADPTTLHGVVSWQSIARWLGRPRTGTPTLSDVLDTKGRVFDYFVLLRDVLDTLRKDEYIFVRGHDRRIAGILTAADVVETYDKTATPFFLIGEVDQELRQIIQNKFDIGTVRRVSRGRPSSFDKLTMGDYEAVLNDVDCWNALGWGLDREVVHERLREIRLVRNRVMHFNASLVDPADAAKLSNFLRVIRHYAK